MRPEERDRGKDTQLVRDRGTEREPEEKKYRGKDIEETEVKRKGERQKGRQRGRAFVMYCTMYIHTLDYMTFQFIKI